MFDGNDKGLRGHSNKIRKPRFNTDIMLMVGDDDKMYDKKLQRYAEDNRAAL